MLCKDENNKPIKPTIICDDDVYGGTYRLLNTVHHEETNIQLVDTTDLQKFKEKIKNTEKVDAVWVETLTNPRLKMPDIKELAKITKEYHPNAMVITDNTFLTPVLKNPLDDGADIALHSLTKYINGHSDVLAGAIVTNNNKIHERVSFLQMATGPSLSPISSSSILRGAKTLVARMKEHQINAQAIAEFLEKRPEVKQVIYAGLESHPQYELSLQNTKKLYTQGNQQIKGCGGMISFYINGDINTTKKFLEKLQLFTVAESLGGVESLIEHPATMTHASIPAENREKFGISDTLIRMSVGIENLEDLKLDLENAFNSLNEIHQNN